MKKPKKRLMIILMSAVMLFSSSAYAAVTIPQGLQQEAANIQLDADSAILIDAATGDILYEKNKDKKEYPASITKLMTVLLAFENCKMDEKLTFSHDAVFSIERGSSHIGIDVGEELTVEQALYAIMLQSANEVSNGVAEHIDGSLDAFAKHMTERAKELGAVNTNFVNANGLHNENHYTTAYDMSLIAKELLKYPEFKTILSTTYYEIPATNIQPETRYLHGQTQLIKPPSIFYYENCEGGKTGFTDQAGNTLVSYAKNNDIEVISVVLKSTGYGEYYDTIKLFDYGLNNFVTKNICTKGTECSSSTVTIKSTFSTLTENVQGAYTDNISVTLPKSYSADEITTTVDVPSDFDTEVHKGDIIGTATFSLNGENLGKTNVEAENDAGVKTEKNKKSNTNFKSVFFISNINPILLVVIAVVTVAVILIILLMIIRKIKGNKRRRMKRNKRKQYTKVSKYNYKVSDRNRRTR